MKINLIINTLKEKLPELFEVQSEDVVKSAMLAFIATFQYRADVVCAKEDSPYLKLTKRLIKKHWDFPRKPTPKQEYIAPTEKKCTKCREIKQILQFDKLPNGRHKPACAKCIYQLYQRPAVLRRLRKKGKVPRCERVLLTPEQKELNRKANIIKQRDKKRAEPRPPKIPKVLIPWAKKPPVIRPTLSLEEKKRRKAENAKKYRKSNPEKVKAERRRYLANPYAKIAKNLRKRLKEVLSAGTKIGSFSKMTGCTKDNLIKHLEGLFKLGMTWDNYGTVWNIDHIKPVAAFDLTQQENKLLVNHFTNLQPMWTEENGDKSSIWEGKRYARG